MSQSKIHNPKHPNPNPNPTPHIKIPQNSLPLQLKSMQQKLQKLLSCLLKNLTTIYKKNGIKFPVQNQMDTLVRLLTPHELLSQFHVVDNFEMFQEGVREKEREIRERRWRSQDRAKERRSQSRDLGEREICMCPYLRKLKQINVDPGQIYNTLQISPSNQTTPITPTQKPRLKLPKSTQNQLSLWLIEQLLQTKPIKIKDLSAKVSQLANRPIDFKCSGGWMQRFWARNPDLKQIWNLRKAGDMVSVREMCQKVRDRLMGMEGQQYGERRKKEQLEQENADGQGYEWNNRQRSEGINQGQLAQDGEMWNRFNDISNRSSNS